MQMISEQKDYSGSVRPAFGNTLLSAVLLTNF